MRSVGAGHGQSKITNGAPRLEGNSCDGSDEMHDDSDRKHCLPCLTFGREPDRSPPRICARIQN